MVFYAFAYDCPVFPESLIEDTFHAKMGTIKDRNGMDLTEAEILRRGGKNTQKGKESESEVAQSCQTLCDPMDCSLPGSSVPGIFQAILPECIAISFSSGSS